MAKTQRKPASRRRRAEAAPGMSCGVIELAPAPRAVVGASGTYSVRLADGGRVTATLAPSVSPAFARECLRDGRMVIVVAGAEGAVIAGALQTQSHPATDARGTLVLSAEQIRLRAKKSLALEVPMARLELENGGAARIEGDRLVIDAAALVRILSAKVEVP